MNQRTGPTPPSSVATVPIAKLNHESGNAKYVGTVSAEKPEIINILSWTSYWPGQEQPWYALGTSSFTKCARTCSYSNDSRNLGNSHVILFRGRILSQLFRENDDWDEKKLPLPRSPHQKWLFYERESQSRTRTFHSNFRHLFNATATFNWDADIRVPYGKCVKLSRPKSTKPAGMAKGKTKLVAWFVSNCKTPSRREEYVKELSKHIPVTMEGKCGRTSECSRHDEDCSLRLKKQHKFYLSFENSLCKDYYTEKVVNALIDNVVPIVYGFVDYEAFLPPKSYIDVQNFTSPKHLADYLIFLDQNDDLYDEYFAWKESYHCISGMLDYVCRMCKYFHDHFNDHQVRDLKQIWNPDRDCLTPEKFHEQHQSFQVPHM